MGILKTFYLSTKCRGYFLASLGRKNWIIFIPTSGHTGIREINKFGIGRYRSDSDIVGTTFNFCN